MPGLGGLVLGFDCLFGEAFYLPPQIPISILV
jgi:hypothetical protein